MIDEKLHINYDEEKIKELQDDYDLYCRAQDIVNMLEQHQKDIYDLYLNAEEENKYDFLLTAADEANILIDRRDMDWEDAVYSVIDDYKHYLTGEEEDE